MEASLIEENIKALITRPQYSLSQVEKETLLLELLRAELFHMRDGIPAYRRFIEKNKVNLEEVQSVVDLPYLPVSVFKQFDLSACQPKDVARVLQSSGTTTGRPSRIFLDRETALRQQRALASILKHFLGKERRPLLVLDTPSAIQGRETLSARGAAILGFAPYASELTYALQGSLTDCVVDIDAVRHFFKKNTDRPVLLFGFSYIVWLQVIQPLLKEGLCFPHADLALFHSGGWKKLSEQAVTNQIFASTCGQVFGTAPSNIRDMYGMVEQVGTVFIDCEAGHKHCSNFSDVIIRHFQTMQPVKKNQQGLIQVLSVLPTSYPGQSILTEDIGLLLGQDDCPCGLPGRYFRFGGRLKKTEIRGCGDTFAMAQSPATIPRENL